jgi:rRNA maturation endonuclease Nob1
VANRLSRTKIDQLWRAYQEHQSVHEVSKRCRCHRSSVERYRRLERWDERLNEARRRAQEQADYNLSQAMAESLALVTEYKQKLAAALAEKTVAEADVTATELERIVKLEAFVLGGAESRQEVLSRFEGWTEKQLETYATTGRVPD